MATSVIFWNLESGNREIWKLPGIGWFWPISMYWVFFPLSFCHWTWFWTRNFQITIFLEISRNFLEIWKFSGICCFGQIATYWVWFPLIFGHWNRFWNQNFKIKSLSNFLCQQLWFCNLSTKFGSISFDSILAFGQLHHSRF